MNNPLNVRIILFASLIFFPLYSGAQDIHFSQLHTVSQMLNPATSGIMSPQFRFSNNYRNQWKQLDIPYNSDYLSLETKLRILGRPIGFGAFLLHDQSSNIYLTADKFYLSFSHALNFRNHQIAFGLQPGLVFKSFNSNVITFGSQFDPGSENYNPNLPSGEDFLNDKMSYFDLNGGILWRTKINKIRYTAGFSINHLNRPVESFYNRNDSTQLPLKYTLHGSLAIPIGEKFEVMPVYLYSYTSGSSEFIGGAITSYLPNISQLAVRKLYVLSQFRTNPFENIDAIILGGGVKFHSIDFCISYDFTVSSLRKASRFQRAFELSLVYELFRTKAEKETEPCFML